MVPSTSCYTPCLSSGRRDGCGARIIDLGRTYGAPGAAGAVRWAHAARAARCHGVVEEWGCVLYHGENMENEVLSHEIFEGFPNTFRQSQRYPLVI